jgi:hypothetical protein
VRRKRNFLTPAQKLEIAIASGFKPRRIDDERALFGLLTAGGVRKVLKKGISIDGDYFAAPELVCFSGKNVQFRRDADPARVIVYTASEPREFLCIAVNLERLGSGEQKALALTASAVWREMAASVRRTFRSFAKEVGSSPAEILLRGTDPAGRVAIKNVPFTTPALAAAAAAADAIAAESAPATPHNPEDLAAGDRFIAECAEKECRRAVMLNDDELEVLHNGVTSGRPLSERESEFFKHFNVSVEEWRVSYETTSEFQSALRFGRVRAA